MSTNQTLDPDFHVAEIEQQGYSVAEGAIAKDLVEEINDEIARLESIGPPNIRPSEFVGYKTLRYFDLLNEGEVWERVATHAFTLKVIRAILGEDMQLSTMGTAVIEPGETRQRIHCDDQLYALKRPHRNLVCNTMWALSNFTVENGATHVVPGSHKFAHYPDDKLTASERMQADPTGSDQNFDTIQVEMPAGSICFVVGTCYHGGGANRSDTRRSALTINYCAGSQRTQENLLFSQSREKLRGFSDELKSILGLRASNYGVGHVNAGDPRKVLERVE